MSLTTVALIRKEGNIPDGVKEHKFDSVIENASNEIERIIESLDKIVVDYSYLDTTDFTNDGGDSYGFSYDQIKDLVQGWDVDTDTDYVALIAKINAALTGNGIDELTNQDKLNLRRAGRDFRKAETLIALSYFAITGNLRPTNDGGFITDINVNAGTTSIMSYDDSIKLSQEFRKRAKELIGQYIVDINSDPSYMDSGGISISAIPPKSQVPVFNTNPRERYVGDSDSI